MTTACKSLTVTMTSLLLIALIPLAIVQADVVVIPTPFLVATARQASSSRAFLGITPGGSDRPSFEEEYDDAYDEETLDLSAADTDSLTVEEYDHEEFEVDMTEVAEEEETEAEELEEVTLAEVFQDSLQEEQAEELEGEVFEDALQEEQVEGEVFEDALQEEQVEEEAFEEEAEDEPLAPVYEERMATDDDSSAFVDRMELADAYDEGETTTAGDDHSVLVATGGDSGSDQVEEEEALAETTAEEAAETSEVVAGDEDTTTEITEKLKTILMKELKYKREDIEVMRPDIATLVVANGLRRPIEGMPANWYVEGTLPKSLVRAKAVKVALTIVVLGAVAAIGVHGDLDLSQLTDQVSEMVGKVPAAIPVALFSKSPAKNAAAPAAKKSSALAVVPAPPVADDDDEVPEPEDKPEKDDGKSHSIKPSVDHSRLKEEDLDKTWLDKGITKVQNCLKGIFSITI
jgi:hypothetical protein